MTYRAELCYGTYGSADLSEIALLVLAVPSRAYREVVSLLSSRLPTGIGVLSLTKGVEPASLRRLSEVLETELASLTPAVAVLSGPNHAEEVAEDQPTASVIASSDPVFAGTLQDIVTSETLRAYVNSDLIGVEFAGAVKNIIAVATGMADGLGFGDNARAALITRGLAEMTRLGLALGAKSETFSGLAGLGDLVGTCTSRHSRNRLAGEMIARGHPPEYRRGRDGHDRGRLDGSAGHPGDCPPGRLGAPDNRQSGGHPVRRQRREDQRPRPDDPPASLRVAAGAEFLTSRH